MSTLDKKICLILNTGWQPIGFISVKKAIVSMYPMNDNDTPSQAMNLEYELDENGFLDFMKPSLINPVGLDEWNKLPIRDFDIPVNTSKRTVRAPIVLITPNYAKMNYREIQPTKRNLYEFYGGKCIWTGKQLSYAEMTMEHMIPRSDGGKNTWENLAPAQKKLNNERGNTPLDKWKFKPQYSLKKPKALAISGLINKAARPEWLYFLIKNK
jgi:5-methylcytosine-specific restriction endonuclease McrA